MYSTHNKTYIHEMTSVSSQHLTIRIHEHVLNERMSFTCTFYKLLKEWDEFSQSIHDYPSGSPLSALAFLVELDRKTQLWMRGFLFFLSQLSRKLRRLRNKLVFSTLSTVSGEQHLSVHLEQGILFLWVSTHRGYGQFIMEPLTVFQVWHSRPHTLIKDPRLFSFSIQGDVIYTLIPVCFLFLSVM